MIYRQTINVERIVLSPLDDTKSRRFVELVKFGDIATFGVLLDDGENERFWEFEMLEPSDYERVKMNVFDAIFECDTMNELREALDAIFEDGFEDILIKDGEEDDDYEYEYDDEDDEECDGDCCRCSKYNP